MLRTLHLLIILSVLLLGRALDLPCIATQAAGLTAYRVQEVAATNCHYWWSNGTKYVLANHAEEPKDPVVNKNSNLLITNECVHHVYYMRDCTSEGSPHEASCTAACSGSEGLHHGYRADRIYWTTVAVASGFVLFLVIAIVRCRGGGSSL